MIERCECRLVDERLEPLLDNDLPAGELVLVRAHLEDCEDCASRFADLRAITAALVADAPEPAFVRASIDRAIAGLSPEPAAPRVSAPAGAAIALLAVVCLACVAFLVGPPRGASVASLGEAVRALGRTAAPLASRWPMPSVFAIDPGVGHDRPGHREEGR